MIFKLVAAFFVSSGITFFLVPLVRLVALKRGILDLPNGTLKIHAAPTPYLGGVAVYLGMLPILVLAAIFDAQVYFALLGFTFLLVLGLIDDLYQISPLQKYLGQLVAGYCFIQAQLCFTQATVIQFFPFLLSYLSATQITILAYGASLFWTTTIINAFNLIDIMDGLLAVLSLSIAFSWLLITGVLQNTLSYSFLLLAAFLGSMVAFFWYNKPKATIFMGDAGSLFVGGFLSVVPFMTYHWQASKDIYELCLPLFIFFIPLMEVICLMVIRTSKGIPFYYGSPHHFISYLKKQEWNTKKIIIFSGAMSLFFSATGFFVAFCYKTKIMLLLSLMLNIFLWLFFLFKKKKFYVF